MFRTILSITALIFCTANASAQNFERLVALENKVAAMESRLAALESKAAPAKSAQAELIPSFAPKQVCVRNADGSVTCGQQVSHYSVPYYAHADADGNVSFSGPSYYAAPGSPCYANGIPRQVCGADGCGFTVYRTPIRRTLFGR